MPDLIAIGLALFLAWLFANASLHKFRETGQYRQLIGVYLSRAAVSANLVRLVAAVELGLALALLLPQSRVGGLLGSALMLLAYGGLMGLQLARGRADIKCGCAGPASRMTITPALIVRNLCCAALALVALAPAVPVAAGIAGMGLTLFVAVFTALAYLAVEQLIANRQQMVGEG